MSWKKVLIVLIALITISSVTATTLLYLYPYNPLKSPKADDSGSTEQGVMEVVNANNQFAFDLYSQLNEVDDGNMFYSPYSMSAALAMTYEGADGQTKDEIKSVFHFPEESTLRPNFASIYNDINAQGFDYELRTGNALWIQNDFPLLGTYLETVESYYGGKAVNLDFVGDPENSAETINSFIEEQTNNKIKDLISPGVINSGIRLILTNAIYFKGTWVYQFEKSSTQDREFKITSTDIKMVPTMYLDNEESRFNYVDLGDMQIVELPYKGDDISMLILLPTDNLASVEPNLTVENLEQWKSRMNEVKLDGIYLPKFEFDTKYSMNEALSALGMPTAFSPGGADFSGITGDKDLFIDFVIHQAYVKVDEEGTEAAAATAIGFGATSISPRKIFRADHPFIFIIQQKDTGNILFLGRVVDPR